MAAADLFKLVFGKPFDEKIANTFHAISEINSCANKYSLIGQLYSLCSISKEKYSVRV